MVIQYCEYTKCHWIVYFKMVDFIWTSIKKRIKKFDHGTFPAWNLLVAPQHNKNKIQKERERKRKGIPWWSSGWESSAFSHGAQVPSLFGELGSSSHVLRSERITKNKQKHTQISYLQDPSDPGSVLGPWIPPCPLPANLWQREHHSHFKRGNWDQRRDKISQVHNVS